jgi:hypothetical protein
LVAFGAGQPAQRTRVAVLQIRIRMKKE